MRTLPWKQKLLKGLKLEETWSDLRLKIISNCSEWIGEGPDLTVRLVDPDEVMVNKVK